MRTLTLACLAWTLPVLGLQASLPPLPPGVWEIKEADTKGYGAVILERTLRIGGHSIDHSYLIRVVSERGKGRVEFQGFPPTAQIEGRTVTRDGAEIPFKAASDFQTKAFIEYGGQSLERKVVVPPGLTKDCVVQIQWSEKVSLELLGQGYDYNVNDFTFHLASTLPTKRMELEMKRDIGWAYDLQSGTSQPQITDNRMAVYKDLPAQDGVPFSEASFRDDPRLVIYQQPRRFMERALFGQGAYWSMVADDWYAPFYRGKYEWGKAWGGFSDSMLLNLPASRQEAALELHRRLLEKVRIPGGLLPEEKAGIPKKAIEKLPDVRDFSAVIKNGYTSYSGFFLLYWVLLDQAQIPAKPILVINRGHRSFRLRQMSIAQFEHCLLMIEETGKPPLVVDPGRRFVNPSLIDPVYQGTDALALNPGPKWGYQVVKIPFQSGERNIRCMHIRIEPSEDQERIQMDASFSGYPEWLERGRFAKIEAKDRSGLLKTSLAGSFSGFEFEHLEVGDLTESPLTWSVSAKRDLDVGKRMEIHPFPLVDPPFFLPKDLPEQRTLPIIFSHVGALEIQSTIKVPAGFDWIPEPSFHQGNAMGEVRFASSMEANGEIKVVLRISTSSLISSPSDYPQFKAFLGWVRVVLDKTLILQRKPA